jgi:hypothetical protein
MAPAFADATRQQLDQIKGLLTRLGELQSLTFKGVGPAGGDIYEVAFAGGKLEIRIMVTPDGVIQGASIRPAS